MPNKLTSLVTEYVEEHIEVFHQHRLAKVKTLKLRDVLKRKNPYLYKAKHFETSDIIVKGIVDAYLSSSEEGIFGDWLEGLAISTNKKVFGGRKSAVIGMDLEFDIGNERQLVAIK